MTFMFVHRRRDHSVHFLLPSIRAAVGLRWKGVEGLVTYACVHLSGYLAPAAEHPLLRASIFGSPRDVRRLPSVADCPHDSAAGVYTGSNASLLTGHDIDLLCAVAHLLPSPAPLRTRTHQFVRRSPSYRYRKFVFEQVLEIPYRFMVFASTLEMFVAVRGAISGLAAETCQQKRNTLPVSRSTSSARRPSWHHAPCRLRSLNPADGDRCQFTANGITITSARDNCSASCPQPPPGAIPPPVAVVRHNPPSPGARIRARRPLHGRLPCRCNRSHPIHCSVCKNRRGIPRSSTRKF